MGSHDLKGRDSQKLLPGHALEADAEHELDHTRALVLAAQIFHDGARLAERERYVVPSVQPAASAAGLGAISWNGTSRPAPARDASRCLPQNRPPRGRRRSGK